jgi:hypothetical protein
MAGVGNYPDKNGVAMTSETRSGLAVLGIIVGMGVVLVTCWWLVPQRLETPFRYTVLIGTLILVWLQRRRKGSVTTANRREPSRRS